MTQVSNMRLGEPYDICVMRQDAPFHWGNPFSHKRLSRAEIVLPTRHDAVVAFADWLAGRKWQHIEPRRRQWMLDNLLTLKGKILGCCCAPAECHADILARAAENKPF
ncbi:MAG: DUF4326 domain-containing protein [Bacillota bacterium]